MRKLKREIERLKKDLQGLQIKYLKLTEKHLDLLKTIKENEPTNTESNGK